MKMYGSKQHCLILGLATQQGCNCLCIQCVTHAVYFADKRTATFSSEAMAVGGRQWK